MKDTKQWILESATILLEKNGYDRSTTRDIANLAGVHESTFFRIFKSKDALLRELLYAMTPGSDDLDIGSLSQGADVQADFKKILYKTVMLHVKHIPIFRIAMHVDEIYNQDRFSKITDMISQTCDYLENLESKGLIVESDYSALAEHINSLSLIKASEFIIGETFGIPLEKSAQNFSNRYSSYFTRLLSPISQ